MNREEQSSGVLVKKPSKFYRILKWCVIAVVSVVVLLFFSVPAYLSSESGNKMLLGNINDSIDGNVRFDEFSIGWFKGVTLTGLRFSDDEGMVSVRVKEIATKPHYGALLRGMLSFGKTTVVEPEIVVNIKEPAKISSAKTKKKSGSGKSKSGQGVLLKKIELDLQRGSFIINMDSGGKVTKGLEFKNIVAKVNLGATGEKSSFDVEMGIEGGGRSSKISAKGGLKAGKGKSWTLKGTSGNFAIKVDDLDLESLGPLLVLIGKDDISPTGKLNADIEAVIDDGRFEKLEAKARLTDMKQIREPVSIDISVSSRGDEIRIDELSLRSSFCQINCSGGKNRMDYTGTVDLAGLQKFAGQYVNLEDFDITGKGSEKGTIYFDKGGIRAVGSGMLENVVIQKDGQRTPVTSAKFSFDMNLDQADEVLEVASLKTSTDFGSIELGKSIIGIGEKGILELDIRGDLDLEKGRSFAVVFYEPFKEVKVAGRIVSSVSVKRKGSGFGVSTDNTRVSDLYLSKAGQKPFEEKRIDLFIDMVLDPEEKTIAIDDLRVVSSQINITKGKFRKGRTKLSGEIEVEYDLAAVSLAASSFLPEGLVMEGKRKDKIKIESRYGEDEENGALANLTTKTSFGFDSAKYMGLEFGKTEMSVEVNKGVLSFDLPGTSVNGGKLAFSGSVDLSEKPMMLKMAKPMQVIDKVQINDEMTDKLLKYVNPLFANAFNVNGVADFYCREMSIPLGGGAKEKITIDGQISMNQVRMQGSGLLSQILSIAGSSLNEEMTVLPTDFQLANGYLSYKDMQINIGDHPLSFMGAVGLDKSLNMTVALPYNIAGKTLRVGQESDRVELVLGGTVDKPSINLQNLFEKAIEKEIDKLIKGGLEDFLRKRD